MASDPPQHAWRCDIPFRPRQPQRRKIPAQLDSHDDLGVAVGGIGAGAINRGPGGGFNRFTLKAGQVDYASFAGNGFALWTAGAGGPRARALRPEAPEGWPCRPEGRYAALFPKAWHVYEQDGVRLSIEQITPVAPGCEPDIDLPVGLFRAHLENTTAAPVSAAVMLSFVNLVGCFGGFRGFGHPGGVAGQWSRPADDGVLMGREVAGAPGEGDGEMFLAARGGEVTLCPAFDPVRDAAALWAGFAADGRIAATGPGWTSGGGFSEFAAPQHAGAVAARIALAPGARQRLDMVLAWDFPVIRFGQGRCWHRHHTTRFGAQGTAAQAIAALAMDQADAWSQAIDRFHAEAAEALDLPDEAAALILNELYMLTEGLSVWTAPTPSQPAHFGLIECPDYPLYDTLDLWVYAAASLDRLFPDLARSVALDYAASVTRADGEPRYHLRSTARFDRQARGMLPHDLGAPNADPFVRPNDYAYQDSSRWKDLNAEFVLTAWRSARRGGARDFFAPVEEAMAALAAFDRDGDGMIENDGVPDQTFDNIPLSGISAYCGGLWLAALRAAAALAEAADESAAAGRWREMSAAAEPAFEAALWTGRHFRVDSSGAFRDAVFAEQMFGPATARMLGLGDVVDPGKARTALATVYRSCFLGAGRGTGAVGVASATQDSSLYAPAGEEGLQWDEILVGFNYSLAAQLRVYGMEAECRALLTALARALGAERGLMFRTPAAILPAQPLYRAQMNLRPLGALVLADAAACRQQIPGPGA